MIWPNRAPVGYLRRYLNSSLVGTEVARVSPVGGHDVAPLGGVLLHHGPSVERVGLQGGGVDDLQPVELDEQGHEQHHDPQAHQPDLPVHAGTPTMVLVASACSRGGVSVSCEIRSSSASRM